MKKCEKRGEDEKRVAAAAASHCSSRHRASLQANETAPQPPSPPLHLSACSRQARPGQRDHHHPKEKRSQSAVHSLSSPHPFALLFPSPPPPPPPRYLNHHHLQFISKQGEQRSPPAPAVALCQQQMMATAAYDGHSSKRLKTEQVSSSVC